MLPRNLLDSIVPSPDWQKAAFDVESTLRPWLEDPRGMPLRVIIGSPGSGIAEVLTCLAGRPGYRLVNPPSVQEIIKGGKEWLKQLQEAPNPVLVFPQIERLFLRHYSGLVLLRQLMAGLSLNRPVCLFGCDSWAWAYLTVALRISVFFPEPHAMKAFDGLCLKEWLSSLARRGFNGPLIIRGAETQEVLLRVGKEVTADTDEGGTTDYFDHLAGESLGMPLLVWELWRESLNPDESAGAKKNGLLSLLASPVQGIHLLNVPPDLKRRDLFILHAVLIHGGLSTESLRTVLQLPAGEIEEGLQRLKDMRLLKSVGVMWQMALPAYPALKKYLEGEGFLVDAL